jgi:hypothetical protein
MAMNSRKLIVIIGIVLVVLVLLKVIASQLCEPEKNNSVVALASDVLSTPSSASNYGQTASAPEPLSWTPFLQQLATFFLKACSR